MRTCVIAVLFIGVLVVGRPTSLSAREHFRRVYRNSRTVVIRHQGRVKKVPANTYYSAYDETTLLWLPSWPVGAIENNRGLREMWRVSDRDGTMPSTPGHVRVSPRRPYPNEVEALAVDDHLDNFRRRR